MALRRSEELTAIDKAFRQTYHSELLPQLKRMEFVRIILFFIFTVWSLGTIAYAGLALWACLNSPDTTLLHYLSVAAIVCSIFVAYRLLEFVLNLILKKKMLNSILKPFKTFKANKIFDIPSTQLIESKIVEKHVFKINPERIEGVYKGVEIKFNTALLFDIERHYSAGKSRTKISNVFSGYIVEMDMNKQFSGHTILESCLYHTDESFFDFLKDDYYEMNEVELEDPEFKKHFTQIKSTDQVEARYLLTTAFMQRYKNIQKAFNASKIECCFLNNNLLLAVSVSRDLFALGDLNKPLTDTKQFTTFLNEIISILEMIEELKLYQTIGL